MLKFSLPASKNYCLFTAASCKLKYFSRVFSSRPPIKLKIQPAPSISPATHMTINKMLKRPLSPHLTIYKTQMSSMMSISVRLTGLLLGAVAWTVFVTKLITDVSVEDVIDALKSLELNDCYWVAAKTVIVFPFSFHFVAGIRHLIFDTAKFMEKRQFFVTGCVAVVLAFTLTLILGNMTEIVEMHDVMQYTKQK